MRSLSRYPVLLSVALSLIFASPVFGSKPYKIYVINQYGAWDIVCDSYTVKKEDRIWEILRRKGSIAEKDFPRFVEMLKQMNPGIKDVNQIYPNQKILIPLKELPLKTGSENVTGPRYVSIPMLPDVLFQRHAVESGESLSGIVAERFGVPWHAVSEMYKDTLKRLNPRIKDLDLIYAGDTVRIPVLETDGFQEERKKEGQPHMMTAQATGDRDLGEADTSDEIVASYSSEEDSVTASASAMSPGHGVVKADTAPSLPNVFPPFKTDTAPWHDIVGSAIKAVGGKLLTSGHLRFPGGDQDDMHLNLTAFPLVEFGGGKHLMMELGAPLPEDIKERIRTTWRDLPIVKARPDQVPAAVLETVFSTLFGDTMYRELTLPAFDDGVQVTLRADWIIAQEKGKGQGRSYHAVTVVKDGHERTSPAVAQYLKNHRVYVVDILAGSGAQNASTALWREKSDWTAPAFIDGTAQEAFVSDLAQALGYVYERQVPLSFEYAGFQVYTTGNLIYGARGLDVVVDYGTFYGDARSAIEATGMTVLSIQAGDNLWDITRELLGVLGFSAAENPVFFAADRHLPKTISMAFTGFLASRGNEEKTLLTFDLPAPEMVHFLHGEHIKTVVVEEKSPSQNRSHMVSWGANL